MKEESKENDQPEISHLTKSRVSSGRNSTFVITFLVGMVFTLILFTSIGFIQYKTKISYKDENKEDIPTVTPEPTQIEELVETPVSSPSASPNPTIKL